MNNFTYAKALIPQPKPVYKPFAKKDFLFSALYFVASYMLVRGVCSGFALGFSVSYAILFGISTAYISKRGVRPDAFTLLCGLLSLLGAASFAVYSDCLVNMFMFVLVVGLYTVYTMGLSRSFTHSQGSFKMLIDMAMTVFYNPFAGFKNVAGSIKASSVKSKKTIYGFAGVLFALPVMAVVIALLCHSDAAFEGLVKDIGKNMLKCLIYLVLSLILMPYLFSSSYAKKSKFKDIKGTSSVFKAKLPESACVSFLGAISAVYVVYLYSQLAYFFSAFKGILPDGYNYTASAFARRGFFEMFVICAINIVLVSAVTAFSRRKTIILKILSCFISLFSVLLIVTAMQKMKLNISIYGLSRNRVLVSVFMLMMLVIIAFYIIHIFAPKVKYMQPIILVCSAMFVALSFADMDARIADYNISAYESGTIDKLDVESIADLSASAIPYLDKLACSDNEEVARQATLELGKKLSYDYADYFTDKESNSFESFWAYNYSRMMAVLTLDDSERSQAIYDVARLFYDDDCYFNEDENYFERYLDNGGYEKFYYNPDTGCYDKCIKYDPDGNRVTADKKS